MFPHAHSWDPRVWRVPQCERKRMNLPVERNRGHWVYRSEDGGYGEEVVESAVIESEIPLIVHGVDKVYNGVECGHWRFSESQVDEEIVRHGSHAFVRQNDPYHRNIAHNGDDDNCAVSHCPEHYSPNRLHKLVPVYLGFILCRGVCPVTLEVNGSDGRIHTYREKMFSVVKIVSFFFFFWLDVMLMFNRPCLLLRKSQIIEFHYAKRVPIRIPQSVVFSDKEGWALCFFKEDKTTDRNALLLHFSSARNQF